MKFVIFFTSLLLTCSTVISQTLPASRSVDWSTAGIRQTLSEPSTVVNFLEFGGIADGATSNDQLLSEALDSFSDTGGIVYFPAGTYRFTEPVSLSDNVILRGESPETSRLIFELNEADDLISVRGNITSVQSSLTTDISKGDVVLEVENPELFAVGDFIRIWENDEALVTSSWALHSTGEITRITNIDGHTLFLRNEVRREFKAENEARVTKLNMVENVGIEQLSIERIDQTEWQSSNIFFEYSANCWVKCVESFNCNFAHVDIRMSTNNEVSGSYFHHAFDYGGGGKAYGVVLQYSSGLCLIENNIFEHLRHSMLLQSGANGNVLGYNYSIDPYWTDVMLPENSAGDLVLHGNYPYSNLFEGNTVQNIVIDNSHGINGSLNTFFRNRAELYGLFMNTDAGDQQNFIGNEITNGSFLMGNFILTGEGNFEFGNNKRGIILPSGTNELPEASLYKTDIPEFYVQHSSWPPLGIPQPIGSSLIEAETRFPSGIYTACSEPLTVSDGNNEDIKHSVSIYPNPSTDFICIQKNPAVSVVSTEVMALNGATILKGARKECLNISELAEGFFFLKVQFSDQQVAVERFVKGR